MNGKYQTWTCAGNACSTNDDGTINCPKDNPGGGDGDLETCKMEADAACTKCQVVCTADGTKGYFCNTKTGKMVEKTCTSCSVDGNTLNCTPAGGGESLADCTATSTEKCNAVCTDDKGYYWNSKTSEIVVKDCVAEGKKCNNNNGSISCVNSGTGEACDPETDNPVCQAGDTVKYCSSTTKEFTIKTDCPQCAISESGKAFFCNGQEKLPKCTSTSTSECFGACESDTTGYYWYKDKLNTKTCTAPKKCDASETGYVDCK